MTNTLRSRGTLIAVLVFTSAYAALRYNVLKGIAWEHLPLYVLNKTVAWAGVTLMLVASWQALARRDNWVSNPHFIQGRALAGLHVLTSVVLLSPARYPDLFDAAHQLKGPGELALLGGVVATACVVSATRSTLLALLLPVAVVAHCALLGARNWLTPDKWPGYMVPITLLSALVALATAVLAAVGAQRRPRT
jgi:hypothetical protein